MSIPIEIYEAAGALAAELRRFWSSNSIAEKRSPNSRLGEASQCFRVVVKKDHVVVEPTRIGVHTLLLPRVPRSFAGVRVVLIDPCAEADRG
jgi:hypothetical protein